MDFRCTPEEREEVGQSKDNDIVPGVSVFCAGSIVLSDFRHRMRKPESTQDWKKSRPIYPVFENFRFRKFFWTTVRDLPPTIPEIRPSEGNMEFNGSSKIFRLLTVKAFASFRTAFGGPPSWLADCV